MTTTDKQSIQNALQKLLTEESTGTQDEICHALQAQGFEINQTKVSRLLRKLGAVKVKDEHGKIVYWLPKEPPPPEMSSPISSLVIDIAANETLIIIHTSPGAASLAARLLDYQNRDTEILGTIAGDDTIFVAPKSNMHIDKTLNEIKKLLQK